jgi:acyl-coenzyme A synthetase/AMP-(fatty) acid ligase
MNMPRANSPSLHDRLAMWADRQDNYLHGSRASLHLTKLLQGTSLNVPLAAFHDRSILISTRDQFTSALTLIELDGVARRIVLCPPDVPHDCVSQVVATAEIDAIVTSSETDELNTLPIPLRSVSNPVITPVVPPKLERVETEWVLFTSGTAGTPKMVRHSLVGLTGAIKAAAKTDRPIVWGTFYDIRRYGGLQIFLRAIFDGASLILSDSAEPAGEHLVRLGKKGLTHISGTPSHWRRALMTPQRDTIKPCYVRLSGEIADQAILDNLRAAYPDARIVHAYASTEAGVGFEVLDCREGFPLSVIDNAGEATFAIKDGVLRVRSPRAARGYVGGEGITLVAEDGFVETGDVIERRGDRYYFVGRSDGVINVGGLKVHPEEVEAVINRRPCVWMCQVRAQKSPITGSIVVADVVLRKGFGTLGDETLKHEILECCQATLARHKVPALIRFVPALKVTENGKIERRYA